MIVSIPWPHKDLSPNARVHWRVRSKRVAAYRNGAAIHARLEGFAAIKAERLVVKITFHPPDKRRRDRDNMIAAIKSACDGIADVLRVDDSKWIPTYEVGAQKQGGAVVFEFEVIA